MDSLFIVTILFHEENCNDSLVICSTVLPPAVRGEDGAARARSLTKHANNNAIMWISGASREIDGKWFLGNHLQCFDLTLTRA